MTRGAGRATSALATEQATPVTPSQHLKLGLIALVATLVVDQAFKVFMLQVVQITPGQVITVLPVLDLVMAWNYGVSFGMFQQDGMAGQWALVAFKVAAVVLIAWWLWRAETGMTALGLGLIAGGAIGNGLDRCSMAASPTSSPSTSPPPPGSSSGTCSTSRMWASLRGSRCFCMSPCSASGPMPRNRHDPEG